MLNLRLMEDNYTDVRLDLSKFIQRGRREGSQLVILALTHDPVIALL